MINDANFFKWNSYSGFRERSVHVISLLSTQEKKKLKPLDQFTSRAPGTWLCFMCFMLSSSSSRWLNKIAALPSNKGLNFPGLGQTWNVINYFQEIVDIAKQSLTWYQRIWNQIKHNNSNNIVKYCIFNSQVFPAEIMLGWGGQKNDCGRSAVHFGSVLEQIFIAQSYWNNNTWHKSFHS